MTESGRWREGWENYHIVGEPSIFGDISCTYFASVYKESSEAA